MNENLTSQIITLKKINLHLIEAGPENGKLIIFLHGFPEFWYSWSRHINYFAKKGYRVVVPDQRGYNLSTKPTKVSEYANLKLVKDIVYLIKFYSYEKAIIVGHDWGAAIAWSLSIYYPSFVEKLVICNVPHPGVFLKYLRTHPTQLKKSWYMFFFQIPWIPEFFAKIGRFKFLKVALKTSTHRFSSKELLLYEQAWRNKNCVTGMINWYRAMVWLKRIPPKTGNVQPPVFIIWGMKDSALEPQLALLSLKKCLNGKLKFFSDATHWVQHEKVTEIQRILNNFFLK